MQATDTRLPAIEDDLALLRDFAARAGDIAMGYFRRDPSVWMKEGQSPVSEADLAADRFLREGLLAARPDYGWLSEETADSPGRLSARRTFVVDPIDGTRAFIDGRDLWCVSVAVVEDRRPVAGVLACPARGEEYFASAGYGAAKNGTALSVAAEEPRLRVGGPKPMIERLPPDLRTRIDHAGHIPSLAYRLAMVAEGSLHATYVKANAHDWDIAAAALILTEAGGRLVGSDRAVPPMATSQTCHGPMVAAGMNLLDRFSGAIFDEKA